MHTATADIHIDRQQSLADVYLPVRALGLPVGAGALAAAVGLSITMGGGLTYFLNAYLIAFMFFFSISIGCLFLVLVTTITRAGWNATSRRVSEILAMGLLPLFVLFLPIIVLLLWGNDDLYIWNNADFMASSKILQQKVSYLNSTWFTIRYVIYGVILCGMAIYFFRTSLSQDKSADPKETLRRETNATWMAFLFAGALTFSAVDWMMTLDPEWYSTIFGVYFFAGSAVAALAYMIIVLMVLQSRGLLRGVVNVEHFHDYAKLMFGFTCFWAYIAFSQYFLIWYANIPEETKFFLVRQGGQALETNWPYVSLALIAGCFVLPFVGMMARSIRRNRNLLFGWAVFLLAMRYLDMYWVIRPSYQPDPAVLQGPTWGLTDILCIIGIGGIWLGTIVRIASNRPILAIGDPRLPESLAFKNQ